MDTSQMNTRLLLDNITKKYGEKTIVDSVSLSLSRGQIGCLLGPSGGGKTTILRTIAGFEPLDSGRIVLHGHTVSEPGLTVPPEKRQVGMVFQDYGLFPHLSVKENIGFGLGKSGQNERDRRIKELLARIDLVDFENSYPHELSGGQQQRVALARSLATEPELILLDEPFSNLDVSLREKLSRDVREIIKDSGATALMVTHNQNEAFAIADEIGIIMDGKLLQWGSGQDLYHRPQTSVVGRFIGEGAILPGTVKDRNSVETPVGLLKGKLTNNYPAGQKVSVLLRPEDIVHDDDSRCKAMVMESAYRGSHIMYTLQLQSGHNIMALVPSHHDHPEGSAIGIHAMPEDIVVFG